MSTELKPRPGARRPGLAAAALLAALVGGVRSDPAAQPRPNILLITIDALRPDHLGVYGYRRPTSPSIDAFAREAVVVTDAIAQAPYTWASLAAVMSGLYPTAARATRPANLDMIDALSPEVQTLARTLGEGGYATMTCVGSPVIDLFGLEHGFEQHRYFPPAEEDRSASGWWPWASWWPWAQPAPHKARASAILPIASRAIRQTHGRPVFMWIHLMEPHGPYVPPEPYRSMFPRERPARHVSLTRIPSYMRVGLFPDLNDYLARYDGEIRSMDDALGRFFAELHAAGLWDRTAIVITADHGEEFYEHGRFEHWTSLYDEELRVPLILKIPGLAPGRAALQAQLVDLFPTLVRLAGLTPPAGLYGRDLLAVLRGQAPAAPHVYAEWAPNPWRRERPRYALRTSAWKYISTLEGDRQLFDLRSDPREQQNIAPREPARVDAFERELSGIVAKGLRDSERIHSHRRAPSPELLERLRALGYAR